MCYNKIKLYNTKGILVEMKSTFVTDFYTKGNCRIHNTCALTMSEVTFIISTGFVGRQKDLELHIPKKYKFKRDFSVYSYVGFKKATEYNLLIDYLKQERQDLKVKWFICDDTYDELLTGLKICLLENYAEGLGPFKKRVLMLLGLKIKRRLKK